MTFGGQCEPQTRSVRTRFFLGEVNVMVSWWSSGHDACPDSERPLFNPQIRHQCLNPLWHFDYLIFILETCPRLSLTNGRVIYNQTALEGRYPARTQARFKCDYGYRRIGAFTRICQASGSWNRNLTFTRCQCKINEIFLEDISPFCRATDTLVLDFWWHLHWSVGHFPLLPSKIYNSQAYCLWQ